MNYYDSPSHPTPRPESVRAYLGADRTPPPRAVRLVDVGDRVAGRIVAATLIPDRDYRTREPKRDRDGREVRVLRVDLDLGVDGLGAVYAGGNPRPGSESIRDAIASALRQAGAVEPEIGGWLVVEFLGVAPSSTPGFADRKRYRATYTPPATHREDD